MITAHTELLRDVLTELQPFLEAHWRELALDQDKVPLTPQYGEYQRREAAGELLLCTLREAGKVIAYFLGFVAPGMHYATCLTLTMDIFYVTPDFRPDDSLDEIEQNLLFKTLFAEVKRAAVARGVQRVFFGSKLAKDVSRFYIEELGLTEVERWFSGWWGK